MNLNALFKLILRQLTVALILFIPTALGTEGLLLLEENIRAERLDLSGADGADGVDGHSGSHLVCDERTLDGNDGEDGGDGEDGEPGANLYLYTDSIDRLNVLKIDQRGGLGGEKGRGGAGGEGCNGGLSGDPGEDGTRGMPGELGMVYIFPRNFELPSVQQSKITTLKKLAANNIFLGKHFWNKIFGLKFLVAPGSYVREHYYTYAHTQYFNIKLDWNTEHDFSKFSDTRIAFKLKDNSFDLTSYQGALIDYRILDADSAYVIQVNNVIRDYQFTNLDLKKLRGHGRALNLEITEKRPLDPLVDSRFVISIKKLNAEDIVEDATKFYDVPSRFITYKNQSFYLALGRMKIPQKYKEKGAKLLINVNVYRKFRGQTRAFGLRGVFKI
ncbi:MAG: hypothetical protein CME62_05305 [Halobacteriovoraceae bacterium]|nr:hypothetical protein [Halobacteriovoraceae bacterium]|tara:strand:+ start:220 stop:1380 length:1161 start_codon:yes stop_codon:yes gene_type:complete